MVAGSFAFVAIASLVIPSVVAIIKYFSALHCPWDLTRYGGFAPFVRLFDAMPAIVKAGQCFPAGHATVGLWLAALCVFWLPHKPKMAFFVFSLGISIGFCTWLGAANAWCTLFISHFVVGLVGRFSHRSDVKFYQTITINEPVSKPSKIIQTHIV